MSFYGLLCAMFLQLFRPCSRVCFAPQLGRGVLTLPSLTLGGPSLCLNSGPGLEPGVNGGLGSL